MKLSNEFITRQKELLLKEKEQLEKEIKKLGSYPDYGSIGDDTTAQLTDFENNKSIENQLEVLLNKVKAALRSIEKGTYGKCKQCREEIETGRLKNMPYADLCVTCQSKNK